MSRTVALLMNGEVKALMKALAPCMPVWMPENFKDLMFVDDLHENLSSFQITWFPLRDDESLGEAAVRIIFSLDDHYNDQVQPDGYRCLMVFGVFYDESMASDLKKLGFRSFSATDFGFIAVK